MQDEREVQQEIDRMFERAGLSEDDRTLWRDRLVAAGEYVRLNFVRIFRDDTDMLRFFTRDMRRRLEAGSDYAKLETVVAEEKAYLADTLRSDGEEK